ncbi:unnamed protein product [Amoebophrya sp. A120]|nr:unnamed protein product [Amoebophrya sp. A120]|eukprot:GSA120T00001951001.1
MGGGRSRSRSPRPRGGGGGRRGSDSRRRGGGRDRGRGRDNNARGGGFDRRPREDGGGSSNQVKTRVGEKGSRDELASAGGDNKKVVKQAWCTPLKRVALRFEDIGATSSQFSKSRTPKITPQTSPVLAPGTAAESSLLAAAGAARAEINQDHSRPTQRTGAATSSGSGQQPGTSRLVPLPNRGEKKIAINISGTGAAASSRTTGRGEGRDQQQHRKHDSSRRRRSPRDRRKRSRDGRRSRNRGGAAGADVNRQERTPSGKGATPRSGVLPGGDKKMPVLFSDLAKQAGGAQGHNTRGSGDRSNRNRNLQTENPYMNQAGDNSGTQKSQRRPPGAAVEMNSLFSKKNRSGRGGFDRDYDPKTECRVAVVLRGLPGSGKSTICALLQKVFGGKSLSYGSYVQKQAAKTMVQNKSGSSLDDSWVTELGSLLKDDSKRFCFIDHIHKTKEARDITEDMLEAEFLEKEKSESSLPGKVLFVDLVHTDDPVTQTGDGDRLYRGPYSAAHIQLCADRVLKRGGAHHLHTHTVPGSGGLDDRKAKASAIVEQQAHGAEFLSISERERYGRYVPVPVEYTPIGQCMEIVAALRSFLPDGPALLAPSRPGEEDEAPKETGEKEEQEEAQPHAAAAGPSSSAASAAAADASTPAGNDDAAASKNQSGEGPPNTTVETEEKKEDGDNKKDPDENKDPGAAAAPSAAGTTSSKSKTLTSRQVKLRLQDALEQANKRERAWRGVSDSELCAHCKAEDVPLTNITAIVKQDKMAEATAKGRRFVDDVPETRLCRPCWDKWDADRKEQLRLAKEREEAEKGGLAKRLYWEIRVDDKIKGMIEGKLPASMKMVEEPHITLVYFGKADTEEEEAANAGVSVHTLEGLHEALLAMDGDKVEVHVEKLIVTDRLVCATASLGDDLILPCAKKYDTDPFHITLGLHADAKAVESADIVNLVESDGDLEGKQIACVKLKKVKKFQGTIALKMG